MKFVHRSFRESGDAINELYYREPSLAYERGVSPPENGEGAVNMLSIAVGAP